MYGWHFCNTTLRDGSPIPADGVWLPPINNIVICKRGYHGSAHPFDALRYAPGSLLTYCEYRGEIAHESDKFCASERRIICRMDADEMLRYFARMQALSVVHLWDAPDVVLDYLATGKAGLRAAAWDAARAAAWAAARAAARDAARDAAWAAAWDAAWDAAWAAAGDAAGAAAGDAAGAAAWAAAWAAAGAAARDAAWAAARDDFTSLVYECFESVVNSDGSPKVAQVSK